MKKALIISIIAFIVTSIAFGVSVAVTGVTDGTFAVGIGDFMSDVETPNEQTFEFTDDFKDINIKNGSADVILKVLDNIQTTTVNYKSANRLMKINAYVKGDKLVVETENKFQFIISWIFSDEDEVVEITIPSKKYRNVDIETASGATEISNLICENFESDVASGSGEYSIFADDINVNVASGAITIENCTELKAKSIKLESASGNHTIKGFETEKFKLDTASGAINAYGISGNGDISLASGDINIEYKTWDNDLSVDALSGDVDVKLPIDSGVTVDLDAASGSVIVRLDSGKDGEIDYSSFSGSTNTGRMGGDNVHQIDVDLASGDVNIHN